jgi:hypothetical protein
MNFGNVRFASFVNIETSDNLEGQRGESRERCIELKPRRQIAGETVVAPFIRRWQKLPKPTADFILLALCACRVNLLEQCFDRRPGAAGFFWL